MEPVTSRDIRSLQEKTDSPRSNEDQEAVAFSFTSLYVDIGFRCEPERDVFVLFVASCLTSLPSRQLPDFHARAGDGVEPAGREALVAFEQAVDRVVLFDVAALELEEDDDAVAFDIL